MIADVYILFISCDYYMWVALINTGGRKWINYEIVNDKIVWRVEVWR